MNFATDAENFDWYRTQAEKGYALAQFELAVMYENGIGVQQDLAKAAEWFRRAEGDDSPNARRLEVQMDSCQAGSLSI